MLGVAMLLGLLLSHIVRVRAVCTDPSNLRPPASPADYTFGTTDPTNSDYTFNIAAWRWDNGIGCVETLSFSPDLSGYSWITASGRSVTVWKD